MVHGELAAEEWDQVQRAVPIACVDFVPVRRGRAGEVSAVGLILRRTPFEDRPNLWCHLGGRVLRDETVADAIIRHARTVEGELVLPDGNERPHALMEFFPTFIDDDFGVDPRKHAISVCYAVDAVGEVTVTKGGEGEQFQWFRPSEIADLQTWPGTQRLIEKVVTATDGDSSTLENLRVAYASLSDEALNHNALVWQTPALALTAEAFLLTIALGADSTPAARIIASFLNLTVSILCLQLMAKHREMTVTNRDDLVFLERRLGIPVFHGKPRKRLPGLAAYKSGHWWMFGFAVLAVLALGILASSLCELLGPQWWSPFSSK